MHRTENDRIAGGSKKQAVEVSVRRWIFKRSVGDRRLFKVPFDQKKILSGHRVIVNRFVRVHL